MTISYTTETGEFLRDSLPSTTYSSNRSYYDKHLKASAPNFERKISYDIDSYQVFNTY